MYVLIDIWMGRESQAQVSGKFIHCINTIFTIRNTDYPPPHSLYLHTHNQSLVVQARRDARFALDHQYDKRATFVKIIDEVR